MRKSPTIERLRECIDFNPETGRMFWRFRPAADFAALRFWRIHVAVHAGTKALACKERSGYLTGRVDGVFVKAHRVAWAIHYGEWPATGIDHFNGDRSDNRIANLRLATKRTNAANMRTRSSNLLGLKGVSRARKRFRAQISIDGRNKNLGHFDTPQEAHAAYCAAAVSQWGEFANDGIRPIR